MSNQTLDFFEAPPVPDHDKDLRLGTSAFTAAGWGGTFYPPGLKSTDFLSHYSKHFNSVEVDSTFYRTPAVPTVRRWFEQTPLDFVFAAKAPQEITHERCMSDCSEELSRYLRTMELLGDKLGPILFQFPYYNRQAISRQEFFERLERFVRDLPDGYKFAVELRNKGWINDKLLDLLRDKEIALALIAHPWMWPAEGYFKKVDPITAPFTYIRLLGDRYGIERITKTWDKTVIDREAELFEWAGVCQRIKRGGKTIYFYANNHYAGHGPATIRLFREIYGRTNSIE